MMLTSDPMSNVSKASNICTLRSQIDFNDTKKLMRFAKNKSFPHKRSPGCDAWLRGGAGGNYLQNSKVRNIRGSDAHLHFQVMCLVININDDTDYIRTKC